MLNYYYSLIVITLFYIAIGEYIKPYDFQFSFARDISSIWSKNITMAST